MRGRWLPLASASGGRITTVAAVALAAALWAAPGCSLSPKPAAELIALERGPRVTVRGIVVDSESGRPVAGIEVFGLPKGKDFPWTEPDLTDSEGRFSVRLAAPCRYGFGLRWNGVSVVTPDPRDPAYIDLDTRPGEAPDDVRLTFLRRAFEEAASQVRPWH